VLLHLLTVTAPLLVQLEEHRLALRQSENVLQVGGGGDITTLYLVGAKLVESAE